MNNEPEAATTEKACTECDAKFTFAKNLKRHMKTAHSNAEKLKCESCDYETFRKDALKRHMMNNVHQSKSESRKVKITSKNQPSAHSTHKRGWFQCKVCEYSSPRRDNLERHFRSNHTDELNSSKISCPAANRGCTHTFVNKDSLKRHVTLRRCKFNATIDEFNLQQSSTDNLYSGINHDNLALPSIESEASDFEESVELPTMQPSNILPDNVHFDQAPASPDSTFNSDSLEILAQGLNLTFIHD